MTLQTIIDAAWDDRANLGLDTKGEIRDAVESALAMLDAGTARVAELTAGRSING
jgi:2,3,4,5-tetrahydropyridine-2-carboxylate N-succinyltransferase